jgi:predicted ABC-type ATPase
MGKLWPNTPTDILKSLKRTNGGSCFICHCWPQWGRKTTSDYYFLPANVPLINSDEIAAELKKSGQSVVNTLEIANGKASELMDAYLNQRTSFGFESNLCDLQTWKSLLEIQKLGYLTEVIYISTSNLDVLNSRIQNRVQLGGHFVLPEVVRERYMAGLNLLNHYFDKPDKLRLFDNSVTMELVAEVARGQVLRRHENLPYWVTQYLGKKFIREEQSEVKTRDMNSVDEVRKRYLESKNNPDLNLPEEPTQSQDKC